MPNLTVTQGIADTGQRYQATPGVQTFLIAGTSPSRGAIAQIAAAMRGILER